MIANEAPRLQSAYLSILEIGGAFGHRFRALIEFLDITTLIVTDIDSVLAPLGDAVAPEDNGGDDEPGQGGMAAGSDCMRSEECRGGKEWGRTCRSGWATSP